MPSTRAPKNPRRRCQPPDGTDTRSPQKDSRLYAIEAEIRGSAAETRLAFRKEKSRPLMQSLYDWLKGQMKTLSVHAEMAKAFGYMLNQGGMR